MGRVTKRTFRLSLLSWLIIFSILCLVVFVYTRFMQIPAVEAKAISDLEDGGCSVQVFYKAVPGPNWAKAIFGENVFTRVDWINLSCDSKTLDEYLEPLARLTHLKSLTINSDSLENVDALKSLKRLEMLELRCKNYYMCLENIDALSSLDLSYVLLERCTRLTSLDPLRKIASLEELDLRACNGIEELDLSGWKQENLKKVSVSKCNGLVVFGGSPGGSNNCELLINECNALEELRIQDNSNLDSIIVNLCPKLVLIGVLPPSLEELRIYYCDLLKKVDGPELPKLIAIEIGACDKLASLDNVSLENVERFRLMQCNGIQRLDFNQPVPKLKSAYVGYCDGIVAIDGLPESVERLEAIGCEVLKRVTPKTGLPNLTALDFIACPNLKEAPELPVGAEIKAPD